MNPQQNAFRFSSSDNNTVTSESTDRTSVLRKHYFQERGFGTICAPFGLVFRSRLEERENSEEVEEQLTSTTRTLCEMIPSGELPHPEAQLHLDEELRRELSRDCSNDSTNLQERNLGRGIPLAVRLEKLKRNKSQESEEMEVVDLDQQNQEWIREISSNIFPSPNHIIYNPSDSHISSAFEQNEDTPRNGGRDENKTSTSEITPDDETFYQMDSNNVMLQKLELNDATLHTVDSNDVMSSTDYVNDVHQDSSVGLFHQQEMNDRRLRDYLLELSRNGMFEELREALEAIRTLNEVCPPMRQGSSALYFDALEGQSSSEQDTASSRYLPAMSQASGSAAEEGHSLMNASSSLEYCELWSGYTSSHELDEFPELGMIPERRLESVPEISEVRVNSSNVSRIRVYV
eukprot:g4960.t2